jgi:GNAT superfamily N-acetyltransferase
VTIDSRSGASYQRELGDGLRLRWSTAADAGRLRALYGHVFRDRPADPPDPLGDAWVVDLLSGRYPLIATGDFALVEAADGQLVAAACLMRQAWEYGGVAIPVGRPELVASHPDYRRRGLVRRIFELLHARSAARGDLALGITGIYYFYRQFGYEYALDLNVGRVVPFSAIPARRTGAAEPYCLRDATPAELPRVQALYDRARAPAQMSTPIDAGYWRWVIDGMDPASGEGWRTQCIVDAAGATVGLLLTRRARWSGALAVSGLAVEPGVPLLAVLPPVLRALREQAPALPGAKPDDPPVQALRLNFGRLDHPVYAALGEARAAPVAPPYSWYVRVPDLPALLRHLAPALERRLTGSVAAGWSGALRLDFYRGGLWLTLERGRRAAVAEWQAEPWGEEPQAGFPPLVFRQLLFGHRRLAELRYAFPDAWASEAAAPVLEALFLRLPAWVLPLDERRGERGPAAARAASPALGGLLERAGQDAAPGLLVLLAQAAADGQHLGLDHARDLVRPLLEVADLLQVLVHEDEGRHRAVDTLVEVAVHDIEVLLALDDAQVDVRALLGDLGHDRDVVEGVAAGVEGEHEDLQRAAAAPPLEVLVADLDLVDELGHPLLVDLHALQVLGEGGGGLEALLGHDGCHSAPPVALA